MTSKFLVSAVLACAICNT